MTRISDRFRRGPAQVCAAAALGTMLALAPQATAAQQGGGGGITTEQLAPLTPAQPQDEDGVVDKSERFITVPFRGAAVSVAPERLEPVETVEAPGVRLRQLDKMTGETETVEIAAGAEAVVDRLRIRVETCRTPPDEATRGTMAFLEIWDTKHGETEPDFAGWMLAESPALSALDHPRYDVWVISCTTLSGSASAEKQ